MIKVVIYVIIGFVILGLVVFTFFPGSLRALMDSGKDVDEKCKPAPGYTEQEWREHMSHHPDIYKECLT